jgi:ferric-dicitrate binding protein FerR (iron transport regulator)
MTACFRAGLLLERRAAGLAEPDKLLLDEHLATCATCREEAQILSGVRGLLGDGFELDPKVRSRVLDQAFNQARNAERPRMRSRVGFVAIAAALSLSVTAVWGLSRAPKVETRLSAVGTPTLTPLSWRPHVVEGRVEVGGRMLSAGEAFGANASLSVKDASVVRLGLARVALDGGTVLDWRGANTSVELKAGRVVLDVGHRDGQSFSVITEDARVEVVGTRFAVSLSEVSVTEGRVKVTLFADASVHELGPGQKLELQPLVGASDTSQATSRGLAVGPSVNVSALLSRARTALGKGKVDQARADVQQALTGKPTAGERAEAQTLLAECALVGGDKKSAQAGYAKVAKENAGTPAGETAAYAAARLEKDPARARALLQDYLRRYPQGRFRSEVQARLSSLPR